MSTDDRTRYWTRANVELRASGFDPADVAGRTAIITVAAPYTNAHRCNNRVRQIGDLILEAIEARGGQGLLVGAPAVSDALTQGTPNAGYSLVSRDLIADAIALAICAIIIVPIVMNGITVVRRERRLALWQFVREYILLERHPSSPCT